jgi:hypothetical protein
VSAIGLDSVRDTVGIIDNEGSSAVFYGDDEPVLALAAHVKIAGFASLGLEFDGFVLEVK